MDGLQLSQGYFLWHGFQDFLVLKGWKAELSLEPPSGFELGTPGLEMQHLNP